MVASSMTLVGKADAASRKEELDSLFARMKRSKNSFASVTVVREWFSSNGTNIDYNTARTLWRRWHSGASNKEEASLPTIEPTPQPSTEEVVPPIVKDTLDTGPERHVVSHGA